MTRKMTRSEAGKLGGRATLEKYGTNFYKKISKKGGKARVRKASPETMAEIGRKGGYATLNKYGTEFYQKNGSKGGHIVAQDGAHMARIGSKGGKAAVKMMREKRGI